EEAVNTDAEQPQQEVADHRADDAHNDVRQQAMVGACELLGQPASAPMMMAMMKPTPGCPNAP
ncbi:MAG TPA: hypothetical protein VKA61_03775, partial [Sphingomicrobium sp.]|nr:hypothetical protein [Sphingomicrobium sp.]